jgi:hypothetical protein
MTNKIQAIRQLKHNLLYIHKIDFHDEGSLTDLARLSPFRFFLVKLLSKLK